jgi:hypothetical protein
MKSTHSEVKQALELVNKIRPLLHGNDPRVIGAALAELTATLILGHAPELRPLILQVHFEALQKMLRLYPDPFNERGNGHERKQ